MASTLNNYRDVGKGGNADLNQGFQFEFTCGNCSRSWKSPFTPYRRGQIAGLVYKFAYYLGDRGGLFRGLDLIANTGQNHAREVALDGALRLAEQRYTDCPSCHRSVCGDCWDEGARLCERCRGEAHGSSARGSPDRSSSGASADEREHGATCSNCGSALSGGRFCAECGFDVAATHKSCPTCGTLCTRAARYCTDCGHAF